MEYNALKQNKKTKFISLYFVSIIPEKSFKSLLMSETLMYPGESDVILIRSIFVDYIVANIEITNGETLGPDIGRDAKYNFVATIILPESQFATDIPLTFEMTDDAGTKKTCTFTYKAGASTLSVDKTTLNFNAGGGSQSVNVTSNDEWSVL